MGDLLVPTHQTLTNPLDSMLLKRVRRWVEVVFRQKTRCGQLDPDGRPWTRCPAKDLARQLEEQEGLVVSVRRIQRSLARLEEEGHFARQQRGIWRRDFWYSFADAEWELQQHRPIAVQTKASLASGASDGSQASVPTVQNLSIPSTNQNLYKTERTRATSSPDGDSPCVPLQGASQGKRAPSPHNGGKDAAQGRLGAVDGLYRVVQRATARGFSVSKRTEGVPAVSNESKRWIEGGFVYEIDHLGRTTKDPLTTAPLR